MRKKKRELEITFASFKAPYHANALATLYGHHFFQIKKLDYLVRARKIRRNNSGLFLVGAYTRMAGYEAKDIVPLYNRLANGYKKTIITFAGSDVLQVDSFNRGGGKFKKDFFKFLNRNDVIVAAVGEHMAKEVFDRYGIYAKVIHMPLNHEFSGKIAPMPKKFSVGCYMPRSGNLFYGYDVITDVVRLLPKIDFHYYSLLGYTPTKEETLIKNLICHKNPINRNEMEEFLSKISCGIRITEHDGNPMSLAEYNISGRWFLFNKEMPYSDSEPIRDPRKIADKIIEISKRVGINNGSEFYRERHDKDKFWKVIGEIYE